MAGKRKAKTGRPPLKIDTDILERLAGMGCTVEEMASAFDCDHRTLERRFAPVIEKGRQAGKKTLRRMQWHGCKGEIVTVKTETVKPDGGVEVVTKQQYIPANVAMLIWLGKQLLGQREPQPDPGAGEHSVEHQAELLRALVAAATASVPTEPPAPPPA